MGYLVKKILKTEQVELMDITKVIIPAAGLGTRFLPFTKAVSKEMLPLLAKPAIQYIVQEALQSGMHDIIIVLNKERDALMHHFDPCVELDEFLSLRARSHLIDDLNQIISASNFIYIRQSEPRGLGHAVCRAHNIIKPDEFFGVILPDDFIVYNIPGLQQLVAIAKKHSASIVAVKEVPRDVISSYGVIAVESQVSDDLLGVKGLVEKPAIVDAPSNLAIVGRYVLSGHIFASLEKINPTGTQEIQLTDGIAEMIRQGHRVLAYKIKGDRYDIGTPIGWFQAMVAFGLTDPILGPQLKEFLHNITRSL